MMWNGLEKSICKCWGLECVKKLWNQWEFQTKGVGNNELNKVDLDEKKTWNFYY